MTVSNEPKDPDAYYREAGSWAADRQIASAKVTRRAWLIAAAACIVAVCEAAALVALIPLKTVEPYTLLVDRQTGYVQALAPLDAQKIAPDSALTQSFLVQYVIARESFNVATIQGEYRKAALWSADGARRDYVSQMQPSTPASPLVRFPRTTVIETSIRSVSPLGSNRAMVRFTTQRRDAGAQPRPLGNWVAIVTYRYSSAPLSLEDRFINPLGFEVTSYSLSQEALPAVQSPQAESSDSDPFELPNASTALRQRGTLMPAAQP